MRELPFRAVLAGAILAGLAAALLVTAFHLVVTEPLIDRAIAIEEELSPSTGGAGEPVVTRDAQRGGLVVGLLMYGLTWSLLFAVVFQLAQRFLPASSPPGRGLILALAAYWSVALFPFLKYPANPPGVGDPESIAYRQGLYVGLLVLSVASTAMAIVLGRYVAGLTLAALPPWLAAVAFVGSCAAIVYLLMPGNPDAVRMPGDVVASFRALSLAGLTLFWFALGAGFALFAARAARGRPEPA